MHIYCACRDRASRRFATSNTSQQTDHSYFGTVTLNRGLCAGIRMNKMIGTFIGWLLNIFCFSFPSVRMYCACSDGASRSVAASNASLLRRPITCYSSLLLLRALIIRRLVFVPILLVAIALRYRDCNQAE